MKRILTLALTFVLLALTVLTAASCSKRKAVDITGIRSLDDLSSMKGVILAAQTGTFHLDALNAQVPSNVEKKEYKDFITLLTALNSGAIDGYVAEEPTAISTTLSDSSLTYVKLVNNVTGFTASPADVGIAVAFKQGNPLVERANAVIASITDAQRNSLMEQACRMASNKTAALGEALALVSANTDTSNGTLRVSMECAYDPFNWTQLTDVNGAVAIEGQDGYANGFDVQIAKYIAAELGMKLEIVANDWDSLIPAVQSGNVDAIIAGMSPTEERAKSVDFTDCYYSSNLVLITKKS